MDPRAPVNAYGQLSPPPTAKNTMSSPMPAGASPARFPQTLSPAPNMYNQMAIFQPVQYTESPAPMKMSPYPVPSSQSTMNAPAGFDPDVWTRFQEFERMQQQQRFQQPPPNMAPSLPVAPQYPQNPQYFQPQYAQQPFPQDSGYGSGMYENLGQAHGMPGQRPQPSAARPGHSYGRVTAKGNARVIRGNVKDSTRPIMNEKRHIYSDADVDGNADMFDGDVTNQEFRDFYYRR